MTGLCRLYLAVLSAYHLVSGAISFCFPTFALRFYKGLYGCDPIERRHLALILKPWGALALFAGLIGAFAAADPERYIGAVAALWTLLVLRLVYRIACRKELAAISRIAPHRNLISLLTIVIGVCILGLWLAAAILKQAE